MTFKKTFFIKFSPWYNFLLLRKSYFIYWNFWFRLFHLYGKLIIWNLFVMLLMNYNASHLHLIGLIMKCLFKTEQHGAKPSDIQWNKMANYTHTKKKEGTPTNIHTVSLNNFIYHYVQLTTTTTTTNITS